MPTTNQLVRKGRRRKKKKERSVALKGNPQRSGVVLKVFTRDPRKPNSANRHCVRVRFKDGTEVTAYVPGEKVALQEHSIVLVTAGRNPDLSGVKYRVVRGVLDDRPETDRRQARSRYGVKKQ